MPRQLRVFLCHASQDKPAVRKMYTYLKQHGVKPWLDREDLLPGQNWEVEIPKALFNSDVILVCLSKNSVNKEGYVQKEIVFALDKALEKPEGTIFVIPVKLEECDVPKRLSLYQWVDYFRPDGRKRLLMGLNVRAQGLGEDVLPVILEDTRRKTAVSPNTQSIALDDGQLGKVLDETFDLLIQRQNDSETTQKAAFKESEREKIELEQSKQPVGRVSNPTKTTNENASQAASLTYKDASAPWVENKLENAATPASKLNVRSLGIGVIVFTCMILAAFGGNYLFKNINSAPTDTIFTPFATKTPTATFTPVPPTFTPTPHIGSTLISGGVTMMYIPQGSFSMGSESYSDEKPIHAVLLDAYYIDKYEVTNTSYKRCVEANVCQPPKQSGSYTRAVYYGNPEFDEYPVINVDWEMAKSYCEWRGGRLPTEAEWEKAACGENGCTYPWGEGIDCDKANYNTNCIGDTTKVGSYLDGVSPYGVYDMAGNVWEWVSDWYDETYYQNSPSSNPLGPNSGQYRMLRGGAWYDFDYNVRSTNRGRYVPSITFDGIGFRCALSQK